MPTPQRLPIVNSDDAVWGDILRQYLMKEHFNDDTDNAANGGHKNVTIRPGTATSGTAPLKFTAGTLMTTPEAGAVEFTTNELFFTTTSGTIRKKFAVYDDTSGAEGDLYYRDSSGNFVRLPIGTTGRTLTVNSGLPAWRDHRSGVVLTIPSWEGDGLDGTESVVLGGDGSFVEIMGADELPGYQIIFKKITGDSNPANPFTITVEGGDPIDGAASVEIVGLYSSVTLVSNGTNWYII